jgi:hypothetical protein
MDWIQFGVPGLLAGAAVGLWRWLKFTNAFGGAETLKRELAALHEATVRTTEQTAQLVAELEAHQRTLDAAAVTPAMALPEVQALIREMDASRTAPPLVWTPGNWTELTTTEASVPDHIVGLSDQTFEMTVTFLPAVTEIPLDTLGRDVSLEYHPPEQVEITSFGDAGRRYTPMGHARWTVRLTSPQAIHGERARLHGVEMRVLTSTVIPWDAPDGWRYTYELEPVDMLAVTSEWQSELLGLINSRPLPEPPLTAPATLAVGTLVTADGRPATVGDTPIGIYLGHGEVQTHGAGIVRLGPLAASTAAAFEALQRGGVETTEAIASLSEFLTLAHRPIGSAMSDAERERFAVRLARHRAQHPEPPPPAVRPSGRRFDLEED